MSVTDLYFFDSYAIIEMIKGNQSYLPYLDAMAVTTKMNILEVVYAMIREERDQLAYEVIKSFYDKTVDLDQNAIFEIAMWRCKQKPKKFSFVDCAGYVLSKRLGIPFVTGDTEFEGEENVIFVR